MSMMHSEMRDMQHNCGGFGGITAVCAGWLASAPL